MRGCKAGNARGKPRRAAGAWLWLLTCSGGDGFSIERLESPAPAQSSLPHLWEEPEGGIGLSWVESGGARGAAGTATLSFARLGASGWSAPGVVARGERWFVNWADFPAVVALGGDRRVAHFLERSDSGPYDYGVQVTCSTDAGRTWSSPRRLHEHAGPGEHGFASLVARDDEHAFAVWLDGRASGAEAGPHGHGAMRLYARTLGADGTLGAECLLDERVCDCCQTAAARAADGALVVAYRDRSSAELRDISVVRVVAGRCEPDAWNSADGWRVEGCPVNGPALDAQGEHLGLAWFTLGSEPQSRVLCAFSSDGGRSFSAPWTLARETPLGRVDAVFDAAGALVVSWLEMVGEGARWRVARVAPDTEAFTLHTVATTRVDRESGFARLAREGSGVVLAWTELEPGPRVALSRMRWD